jgi:hypothetical protein
MRENWNSLAQQYLQLVSAGTDTGAVRAFCGQAASALPKDNPAALAWFISALQNTRTKWFVAAVMAQAMPVPRTLLDPLLVAALLEPNPSANRLFIEPCVRTFGAAEVSAHVSALSTTPGVAEINGVRQAMYWVPRPGA